MNSSMVLTVSFQRTEHNSFLLCRWHELPTDYQKYKTWKEREEERKGAENTGMNRSSVTAHHVNHLDRSPNPDWPSGGNLVPPGNPTHD
ncbi:hypothetical protein YC2023_119146 [Brassica napus]